MNSDIEEESCRSFVGSLIITIDNEMSSGSLPYDFETALEFVKINVTSILQGHSCWNIRIHSDTKIQAHQKLLDSLKDIFISSDIHQAVVVFNVSLESMNIDDVHTSVSEYIVSLMNSSQLQLESIIEPIGVFEARWNDKSYEKITRIS